MCSRDFEYPFKGDSKWVGVMVIDRRLFVKLSLLIPVAFLVSCKEENFSDMSAARNEDRVYFKESFARIVDGESGFKVLEILLSPELFSQSERKQLQELGPSYGLDRGRHMLGIKIGFEQGVIKPANSDVRWLEMTFWNYDEPTPVLYIDGKVSSENEILEVDGNLVKGGWMIGRFRGRKIFRNSRSREDVYLWNVRLSVSLN